MLRLGIDIDGVLADFTRAFANTVNEIWPKRLPEDYEPTTWEWGGSDLKPEEIHQVWEKLKNVENFWLKVPCYLENVEELRIFLNQRLHDTCVYYITSRIQTYRGYSVMMQTQRWLDAWGLLKPNTSVLPVLGSLSTQEHIPPKNMIVQALGIHAHLDDYLPTVRSLAEYGVLLDRPWNRDNRPESLPVVNSLFDFLRILQ